MDEIIVRAKSTIIEILTASSEENLHIPQSELIDTIDLLDRLVQSDSPRNEWTHLFCRQLNRLMDYNASLSAQFWTGLQGDILYVLNGPNDGQNMSGSWNRFFERMNYEDKLKQRELKFHQTYGERKNFSQLFCEHKEFIEKYLEKCISLHSQIQAESFMEDLDDFLQKNCGLTEASYAGISPKDLREKLKFIKVAFDWSNRSLQYVHPEFVEDTNLNAEVNINLGNYLPSAEPRLDRRFFASKLEEALTSNRWIVILGEPGSAKTTMLRWITRVFAETICLGKEEVILENGYQSVVRVPILIRMGEFSAWLDQYQNKTLIDYIGEHTWFSESYIHDDNGKVLKELIYHGHALILLDGLDEIHETGRRSKIVDLVKNFIDEYVRAPDFLSAFDDQIFSDTTLRSYGLVAETQPLSKYGGNQIIITSRIIGYQLYPLIGTFISHYSLLLMDHGEAKNFISKWMAQLEKGIVEILLDQGLNIDEDTRKTLSIRRCKVIQSMFEKSPESLMSNPLLLSLVCMLNFQTSNEFLPKSRVQMYNQAVNAALRVWRSQESNISESVLTNVLIDLAIYLHLHSSSGLIDGFDMEHLCRYSLQRQDLLRNRTELRENASRLINLVDFNIGIIAERGLQVFGFLHLSFQEYFVAQSFVKSSSVEETVKHILANTVNPRFRESLRLALGWISWKWSFDDYDKFCCLLFTPSQNYAIPIGALLFFNAFVDILTWPSKSTIFIAFNSILDYPHHIITQEYLISNLSKFSSDIIIEWMQLRLKDSKFLTKFCQCLLLQFDQKFATFLVPESISFVICQQLWSLHSISSSIEFLIDQTFRRIMTLEDAPNNTFNKNLSLYFLSHTIHASDIHPLILSVIIAVCGGILFTEKELIIKIQFSPKRMHRELSITPSIIEYLANNKQSHSTKVQTLTKQYENILQKALQSDTSIDTVDTFIALICLKGLPEPSIYQQYDGYQALPLALDRLKQTWYNWKHSCDFICKVSLKNIVDRCSIRLEIEAIIDMFFSQSTQSNEVQLTFSLACVAALDKLGILWSADLFTSAIFLRETMGQIPAGEPELNSSDKIRELNYMHENIHSMLIFQYDPNFLLTYIPYSLQKLYYCLMIDPANNSHPLPLVILLSQCLILFDEIDKNDPNFFFVLSILQPRFKEHMLENFVSVLFWKANSEFVYIRKKQEEFLKATKEYLLVTEMFPAEPRDWRIFINMERQRIYDAIRTQQNREKDLRLFAASISLARLCQAKYHSHDDSTANVTSLSTDEREELHFALENIVDPILRIVALSIILDMKDPLFFDEGQREALRWEMITLLQPLVSRLPLLTATLLFVRCHSLRRIFQVPFQHMADVIGTKLNETPLDGRNQDQEAAFIALKQLNNSDLSHHLSEFIQRTTANLSDLLQFNSTKLFRYITSTTPFDTEKTIFLSTMYVTELTFDAQILQMNTSGIYKTKISLLNEFNQLWNDSSKYGKIMTYKTAIWITKHIQMLERKELDQIINDMCSCLIIERNALLVIEKWLHYRLTENLKFFAHYAALGLVFEGSDNPDLIDIIIEIFDIDNEFRLKHLVARLFNSPLIDLTSFRQILIALNRNILYSSKISTRIGLRDILELILDLELERITSNAHRSSECSTNPFLLMIDDCSHDLQLYLIGYIRMFVNEQNDIKNTFKEEHITVVVRWIVESSIWIDKTNHFSHELYDYIFALLHDQRFPQIQKAVVNGLNSVFIRSMTSENHVFLTYDVVSHLENVICSRNIYTEDLLADCLLAYGNLILKSQNFQASQNVSIAIQRSLTILFETSSELISIRAAFCLIIAQYPFVKSSTIAAWFSNKWNLTSEKKYNILLQQTLYRWKENLFSNDVEEIVDYIETHSNEILDMFLLEFYNYLHNKSGNNYYSNPVPDYIKIAEEFSRKNFKVFYDAVQKSSFGEDNLKSELYHYLCHGKNLTDNETVIKLYAAFGVLTIELIDMLKWFENTQDDSIRSKDRSIKWDFKKIKQVSDREVIEILFDLLYSIMRAIKYSKLSFVPILLAQLVDAHVISSLEVHQRVSLITPNFFDNINEINRYQAQQIWNLLLKLTCIKAMPWWNSETELYTESDIEEEFDRETENLKKYSFLLFRRNCFLTIFRSISGKGKFDDPFTFLSNFPINTYLSSY